MWLGWSGLGVGDFITINRTSGLECDQSSEKFSFRSMSADAVGGVRAIAVLCGGDRRSITLFITAVERAPLIKGGRQFSRFRFRSISDLARSRGAEFRCDQKFLDGGKLPSPLFDCRRAFLDKIVVILQGDFFVTQFALDPLDVSLHLQGREH